MALLGPHQLERLPLTKHQLGHFPTTSSGGRFSRPTTTNILSTAQHHPVPLHQPGKTLRCSAIAIDAASTFSDVAGVKWGFTSLQGAREEMEDDIVIRSDGGLDGFSFAAVLDGHGGFNSVNFLRDELYKECVAALQGGSLLGGKDYNAIKEALESAFVNVDSKLLTWLETNHAEDESGSTATVVIIASDRLIISHIGDSNVVLSRSGKPEVLTDPHRPYGSNKSSLQEIRRIREAGGWINNGRICGDIAVSRAFGDMRFKTKKNEMLQKGVKEGRWTEKFISRVQFNGDLVVASPDIYQVTLGSDAEFILLASDGLWDYIKSSDAVQFVRDQLKQHGNVQVACEELARTALDRRSQDNVSIIIADLGFLFELVKKEDRLANRASAAEKCSV
ncbi:Protein phosphatase 2C 57 [Linum grandiflorum]